jgi:GxxExxY protein
LELKSAEKTIDAHIAQALNYLKATPLRLAILLNLGKEKEKLAGSLFLGRQIICVDNRELFAIFE